MSGKHSRNIQRAACLITTGLSVGWIMGLSASPVTQAVLASLLGVASALLVALPASATSSTAEEHAPQPAPGYLPSEHSRSESLILLSVLSLFVACGASAGLYARTHELLGLSPSGVTSKWRSTGLSDEAIARRLFDQMYPDTSTAHGDNTAHGEKAEHKEQPAGNPHAGALYSSAGEKECVEYNSVGDSDLQRLMLVSSDPATKEFAKSTSDPKVLRVALKEFLCAR